MRIVMIAVGTWGDVRPNVALGQALLRAGYEVLVVSSEPFRQWVEARGVAFAGVQLDMQGMMDAVMGGDFSVRRLLDARKTIRTEIVQAGKALAAVVHEGDALLANELALSWLNGIVEKYHARLIFTNLQPQAPTRQYPAMGWPSLGAYNRPSYGPARRSTWLTQGSIGNQIRSEHLNLPKQTWAKHKAMLDSTPSLVMASRHVVPPPADWPPQHRVTGYIFDEEGEWEAPQALLDFLGAGEKPVYIGFGSMAVRKPEAMTRVLIEAVQRSGRRAILLSGWAGIGALEMPKEVFLLDYGPHGWLFPRVAAVVHHGGAGTTAAGLRAGVPSIIVPFFLDQPFWGRRVYELGVGTKPIPSGGLTADKLAAAIGEATSNEAMLEKAAALSQRIAAEDGPGEAVKAVREILGS
jgi:UDP:flavonoid glycosyltransferase YjiC (YdhE family)